MISKYDQNLLLFYKFIEPSGTDVVNYAVNGPTQRTNGDPLDTSLEWTSPYYSADDTSEVWGVDGLYRIWAGPASGSFFPPQWGTANYAASGHMDPDNTFLRGRHRIRSRNLDDSAITAAVNSGTFSIGFWVCPAFEHAITHSDYVIWAGINDGAVAGSRTFSMTAQRSTADMQFKIGATTIVSSISVSGAAGQGLWNHIVFSYDPNASDEGVYVRTYLNGINIANYKTSAPSFANPSIHLSFMDSWLPAGPANQSFGAIKDFVLFNKILTSGEVSDIFNNGISDQPVLYSTDSDLMLWYRFNEGSGVPIRSWAANTPTTHQDGGGVLDSNLQWNNTPNNGIDGVTSINTASAGHWAPYQWGENRPTPSSTTTDLYHALQGAVIDDSTIAGTIASGSFSVGFWFNFENVNDIYRLLFSFDRTTDDPSELALGFNVYNQNRYRFVYNNGVGSLKYFYDLTNSGSGEMWNHIVLTHTEGGDAGVYAKFYVNGQIRNTITDPEWDSLLSPYYLTFFNAHADYSDKQFKGAINDFALFKRALNADEVGAWFNQGITLVSTSTNGKIGGYIEGVEGTRVSGLIGAYLPSYGEGSGLIGSYIFSAYRSSGVIGGWASGVGLVSGIIGGYVFGANQTSGIIGGWVSGVGQVSGIIGGYVFGANRSSGIIGGYVHGVVQYSGIIGGFVNGGFAGSGVFDAGFTVNALTAADFDALVEVKITDNTDFDAEVTVFKAERGPFVAIKYPDGIGFAEGHDVSGVLAPLTPWFVGSGVAVDDKSINKTLWNFGDLSPVVTGVPSGNDEYATAHTYSQSGIYMAVFRAIDSNGMIGSDSVKIHLASGVPMPDVQLSANPTEGNAPLSVNFDYTITNIPDGVTITSKVLFFGNGKSTINPDVTYVYMEPGEYIPILVVLDSRGFYTCDSLRIGVNN